LTGICWLVSRSPRVCAWTQHWWPRSAYCA